MQTAICHRTRNQPMLGGENSDLAVGFAARHALEHCAFALSQLRRSPLTCTALLDTRR